MGKDEKKYSNNRENNDTSLIREDDINISNVGMKKPDPSSHCSIAQIPDTDEFAQNKANYEKQEKRRRLGIHERRKKEEEELIVKEEQCD